MPWTPDKGLHGYHWPAADPTAILLLQHGYAEHAGRYVDHYASIVPRLVAAGISVYAFDMRGHGQSDGARAVTDVNSAVEDHRRARHLLAQSGLPLFLLGHSLGGLVTAASVVRETASVAGVIMTSPALLVRSNVTARTIVRLIARFVPGFGLASSQSPEGLSRLPDEVNAFVEDEHVYRGKMPAKLAASALSVGRETWGRYPAWQVPALVIHGDDDSFAPVEGSRLFVGLIGATDKQLHIVQGGAHELLNDIDREEIASLILSWITARVSLKVTQ